MSHAAKPGEARHDSEANAAHAVAEAKRDRLQSQRIAALEAQLAALQEQVSDYSKNSDIFERERDEARAEVERLREVIAAHAGCPWPRREDCVVCRDALKAGAK